MIDNATNKIISEHFSMLLTRYQMRLETEKEPTRGFLKKSFLKICCKFTEEHPCRSAISLKLLCNFIEIALRHGCSPVNLLHIFRTLFPRNTSGWLLLETPMKSSDFDFDNVDKMYYNCHRSLSYGVLCIDSSDWIRRQQKRQ